MSQPVTRRRWFARVGAIALLYPVASAASGMDSYLQALEPAAEETPRSLAIKSAPISQYGPSELLQTLRALRITR